MDKIYVLFFEAFRFLRKGFSQKCLYTSLTMTLQALVWNRLTGTEGSSMPPTFYHLLTLHLPGLSKRPGQSVSQIRGLRDTLNRVTPDPDPESDLLKLNDIWVPWGKQAAQGSQPHLCQTLFSLSTFL